MFKLIRRIRQRRKEKREGIRYLRCPSCQKKFWGQLPTSKLIRSFRAECPKCKASVDEENVTLTRRQVGTKWGKAIARAAWHCLICPVKPLTATKKIIDLKEKVVKSFDRIEERLDVQGSVIGEMGKLVSGLISGALTPVTFEAYRLKPLNEQTRIVTYEGHSLKCVVIRRRSFVDTEEIESNTSWQSFFVTRCAKSHDRGDFEGDFSLVPEMRLAEICAISFRALAPFRPEDIISFFETSYLEFKVQQNIKSRVSLSEFISGRAIIPFEFANPIIVPGGRSLEFEIHSPGALRSQIDPFKLRVSLHGRELGQRGTRHYA